MTTPIHPSHFFFHRKEVWKEFIFKISSPMIKDKCLLLYFLEIIVPVVRFVFLTMQGNIEPFFTNFVQNEYAHIISKPVNKAFTDMLDNNMFNCKCFRCTKMQLVFNNNCIYLEDKK